MMLQVPHRMHAAWVTILSMGIVSLSLILLIYQTALLDRTLSRRTDAIERSIAETKLDTRRDRQVTEHNLETMRKYIDMQHLLLKDMQAKLASIAK